MNVNRFKQLLEATMGNVRPLLLEQNPTGDTPSQNVDQSKTVKINGKDILVYNEATKKNSSYYHLLFQAYKDQIIDNTGGGVLRSIKDVDQSLINFTIEFTGKKGGNFNVECDTLNDEGNASYGYLQHFMEPGKNIDITDDTRLMLKRYCIALFPNQNFSYKATTPLYDK